MWRESPELPCCRVSCCGSRAEVSTCCASGRRLRFRTRRTVARIFWKARGGARRNWSGGFGAILTSGCGFTGDGRRGRRENRGCTKGRERGNKGTRDQEDEGVESGKWGVQRQRTMSVGISDDDWRIGGATRRET